jgi:hypothetical protein
MDSSANRATTSEIALREYAEADAQLRRILESVRQIAHALEGEGWKNVALPGQQPAAAKKPSSTVDLASWPDRQEVLQAISRWYKARAGLAGRPVGPTGTISDMDLFGS